MEAPKTKNNKTLHTFNIDKDHLKLLQALATTQKIKINELLAEALSTYFNSIDKKTKADALKKYETIQALLN